MYLSYIANEIVRHAVERLGIQIETLGFENETAMVESLAAIEPPRNQIQSCLADGAGNLLSYMHNPFLK